MTTTSAITVRRAVPEDWAAIFRIHEHPAVYGATLQLPYASQEVWRKKLANDTPGVYHLVAVLEGEVAGVLSLEAYSGPRIAHAGTLGISVSENRHGKGIGSALMRAAVELADNWLNLKRLELEVYTDNQAAIQLYERFGFEREGTKRMHAFRDGAFADSHVMARLRP